MAPTVPPRRRYIVHGISVSLNHNLLARGGCGSIGLLSTGSCAVPVLQNPGFSWRRTHGCLRHSSSDRIFACGCHEDVA